jgi:tetratricopeptide (TPR) repeat protein
VGRDPVPEVHLFENNSSALIAWRRAGVRERVLVHLDGHSDLDWLPDETIARLAAATPEELSDLELHPYSMDGGTMDRFAIWNFIYPAARLGIVRELVWVVPDGTLADRAAAERLLREVILYKIQWLRLEEARSLRYDGRVVRGEILGLPVTICELDDLPELPEPVLLDIDLDYFTTRSALTQYVTDVPWVLPERVVVTLRDKAVQTDLATVCLSTFGGFLSPGNRWLGRSLERWLRAPHRPPAGSELDHVRLEQSAPGDPARQLRTYYELVGRWPEDPTLWYALADVLEGSGRFDEADQARRRAAKLDPVLQHGHLFAADRLWINEAYEAALARYDRYLAQVQGGPFEAYALRRRAGCLIRLRRDAEALAALGRVVELAPAHADSRLDLGVLLRERGAIAEALEQLAEARRILPERGVYARALGTTYLLSGRPQQALPHLEFAVRCQPCLPAARGNLVTALFQLGRYADAARQLGVALALQPDNPQLASIAGQLRRHGVAVRQVAAP